MQSQVKRRDLLERLKDITNYLHENKNLNSYCGPGKDFVKEFEAIHQDILTNYGKNEIIDWHVIHDAGCTCDDSDLPHHRSTNEEIRRLIHDMKCFISLLDPPTSKQ